jgi:hypothetical protein
MNTINPHDQDDEISKPSITISVASDQQTDHEENRKLPPINIFNLHYLLYGKKNHNGTTPQENPYLRQFICTDALTLIQTHEAFRSWRSQSAKTLRKEISEGLAACVRTQQLLGLVDDQRNLCLFDLCSGKGMLSILLANQFPKAVIHMVDYHKGMNLTHLEGLPNVHFHCMDLFSQELQQLITDQVKQNKIVFLLGVHLCGDLSRRAMELWETCGAKALIVSPCCLVVEKRPLKRRYGTFGYHLKDQARETGTDPYDLWCQLLYQAIPRQIGYDRVQVTMECDAGVLSDKNAYLTATRMGPDVTRTGCQPCGDTA